MVFEKNAQFEPAQPNLHALVYGRNPAGDIPAFPTITIALLTFAGCGFLAFGVLQQQRNLLVPAAVALVAAFLLTLLMGRIRSKGMLQYAQTLDDAITEVVTLRDSVAKFMTELDARTSRYFHCITTTKVTSYFKLRQIEASLSLLIEKLTSLATDITPARLLACHELLSAPLEYSDSLVANTGNLHYEALPDLHATVKKLMGELMSGIEALEREIAVSKAMEMEESEESEE